MFGGEWAWGFCRHDYYVGYVPSAALGRGGPTPTHVIATPLALIFDDPDIKSGITGRLPMGARVAAMETNEEGFIRTARGRSEEHTSELQSLMRSSYAVFRL